MVNINSYDLECNSPKLRELEGSSAIYSVHLRPKPENIEEYMRFISMLRLKRAMIAKSMGDESKLRIDIEPYVDKKLPYSPELFRHFEDIYTYITPPLYIGMSEDIVGRIEKHFRDLSEKLDSLNQFEDYEFELNDEVGTYKLHSDLSVQRSSFANRITELIRLTFPKTESRPSTSSFEFNVYPLPNTISRKEILIIEKNLINSLLPFGNYSY